jgi:miniconductance mechanosensitive channel
MYIEEFLKNHPDLHHEDMALLVRQLEPSSKGLPLELYVFTKTTEWAEYEIIQAEIFDHLVATAALFDLQVFQEPASGDFAALAS